MQQIQLYEYLGINNDPIFNQIKDLKKRGSMKVQLPESVLIITLNSWGIYEVSNEELHESFSQINDCYEFVNEYLNEIELEDGVYL